MSHVVETGLLSGGMKCYPESQWFPLDSEENETMNVDNSALTNQRWTAAQLRKLPEKERDAILETAAFAEEEYRNNPELTAFDAFGKEDLHGDSSSTETR